MISTQNVDLTSAWLDLGQGPIEATTLSVASAQFAMADSVPGASDVDFILKVGERDTFATTSHVWARAVLGVARIAYAPVSASGGGSSSAANPYPAADYAKDGSDATGVTPLSGAAGLRGWLSELVSLARAKYDFSEVVLTDGTTFYLERDVINQNTGAVTTTYINVATGAAANPQPAASSLFSTSKGQATAALQQAIVSALGGLPSAIGGKTTAAASLGVALSADQASGPLALDATLQAIKTLLASQGDVAEVVLTDGTLFYIERDVTNETTNATATTYINISTGAAANPQPAASTLYPASKGQATAALQQAIVAALAGLPTTLGQKAMAASLGVAIATDQQPVPTQIFAPIKNATVPLTAGPTTTTTPVALPAQAIGTVNSYRARNAATSASAIAWKLSTVAGGEAATLATPYSTAGTGGSAGDKQMDPGGSEVFGLTAAQQTALAAGTLYLSAITPAGGSGVIYITPGVGA